MFDTDFLGCDNDAMLMTVQEAKKLYDLTNNQIYYALRTGQVESIRIGRRWLLVVESLPAVWPTRTSWQRRREARLREAA
jgi:hypothetical protein